MSYSLDKLPNDPKEFPPPPLYAIWVQEVTWNHNPPAAAPSKDKHGQIRHYDDLAKAKKRIRAYSAPGRYAVSRGYGDAGKFFTNWAIYRWDTDKGEYIMQYEGRAGQDIKGNALFQETFKGPKKYAVRRLEAEEQEAIASILEVAK